MLIQDIPQAIIYFTRMTELNPASLRGYNQLGFVYFNLKEFEKAVEYYKMALEIDPRCSIALNNIGNALRSLGCNK